MYKQLIIIIFTLITLQLKAQNTIISGKAIDYQGKEISFYTYSDPIVHKKHDLGNVKVGVDGTFSLTISLNQTIEVYADLEKFTGTLVTEPGRNYSITLPPFTPRTAIEARSPYFQPALYWLGLPQSDNKDLNFVVRSFITDYNVEIVKNTDAIYKNESKETVKEIIERLEQKYSVNKNDFFLTLKLYSFADLEYVVNHRTSDVIIEKYFAQKPLKLQNPAYQKIFKSLFTDFLRKEAQDIKNKKINTLVNSGSFSGLVSYFEPRGYHKDFAELVVLKGLYDGYYTGSFNKESILKAFDQAHTAVSSEGLKPIVSLILHKLTSLAVGGKAPAIELTNSKNEPVTLEKYQGKFLYLVFFKSNSPDCRAELDSIVSLEKKFRQALSIVSISTDEHFESSAKLWKDKGYVWELLNGSSKKQLISNYNADIVPAFFLLAPDGTFLLSQAPPPSRDFESTFLKIYRDYNFKHQRK
jgi:peroxiredoxin